MIYWVLRRQGILRTDLKTEIVGHDFIEFADDYELQNADLKPRKEENHGDGFQAIPNTPNPNKT